jgi:hypothetical protein
MKYTVILGNYTTPTYWQMGAQFTEVKRIEVEAPSAYDAKCRAEDKNPTLVVHRVM